MVRAPFFVLSLFMEPSVIQYTSIMLERLSTVDSFFCLMHSTSYEPLDYIDMFRYASGMLQTSKKLASLPPGRQLDQLAIALSEQIAKETGRPALDILEEIIETGQALKNAPQKKSAANSAKRSDVSPKSGAQTWAISKA